jgi:hypothetical protein
MERDSDSVTAAFHERRSAVRADCAPADVWSSSKAGALELTADARARV